MEKEDDSSTIVCIRLAKVSPALPESSCSAHKFCDVKVIVAVLATTKEPNQSLFLQQERARLGII